MQMAKRIRAKLVLELLEKGMSGREIRSTRRISQRSIKLVREAVFVNVVIAGLSARAFSF